MKIKRTLEEKISDFIKRYKFLSDKKYYKTNKISVAAWDSWAANGQAGGCDVCDAKHHNYTLHNTRYSIGHSGKGAWSWNGFGNLCSGCYSELERQVDYEFIKY